jgi:hypothetical protein
MAHLLVMMRTILARAGHVIGENPPSAFAKLRRRHGGRYGCRRADRGGGL